MVEYDIYLDNTDKLIEWIKQQPNFLDLRSGSGKIYCRFNHLTEQEQIDFKQEIANRLFQIDIGNNTFEYTLPKLQAIQTDALIYVTELSQTVTNIGTSFVDLYNDYGGRNFFVDLTGYKKIRYHINMNENGSTGTLNFRIVDNANQTNVLLDIVVTNGQNSGNIIIPDPLFKNFRGRVRIQVKSTVATDDPRYDRIMLHALR